MPVKYSLSTHNTRTEFQLSTQFPPLAIVFHKDPISPYSLGLFHFSFHHLSQMKQTLELGLGLGVNLLLVLLLVLSISCCTVVVVVDAKCSQTCDLALASYYLWQNSNVTFVRNVLQSTNEEILAYNPSITNIDSVQAFSRLNVPFTCGCLSDQSLGHLFTYMVSSGDTYEMISGTYYSKLTTVDLLTRFNSYDVSNVPVGVTLNVPVPCSCGNAAVSKDYGLFLTYPLRENETLASVASNANVTEDLVQRYNPNADFSEGSGILYIPARDSNGLFVPLKSSTGLNSGAIAGISIAAVAAAVILAVCIFLGFLRKKKVKDSRLLSAQSEDRSPQHRYASGRALVNTYGSTGVAGGTSAGLSGITVDKSVEFSYDELATASDNFSLANKIGQGGFGAVYYAELRGEKAAIKKMDMQASKEFLAELKVLTNVHHLNLVRLIGYCVEGSLFLVYEYIENGNLSQHLRGSEREPLSWSTRLQIALDSARGLEYIHEHTVPVYIHRDIKTANILIDKNYHGKVADFGLTKLTEIGGTSLPTRNVGTSLPTRIVGTFGYMPPEYAQYGEVSPKVDVYAFGVVLYELISAKEAIVRMNGPVTESKGLVAMFEEVLNQPDPKDDLVNMIDPRMGDNYPFDSVKKMAQLAKACTQENPQLRPSMRSIVVALMTLSSTTEDWDVGSFYENQALVNLMSGR